MSDQNVFDQNSGTVETPPNVSSESLFSDKLAVIKNEEGKQKYDSVEKALEGLANAQSYIPQLKTEISAKDQEIERLKAELSKTGAVEDVVSRLLNNTADTQVTPQVSADQPSAGLDENAVTDLIKNYLDQRATQDNHQTNVGKVQEALVSKFGEKASEVVKAKAQELGTTTAELEKLAMTSPGVVLGLFGTPQVQPPKGTNTSSVSIPPYGAIGQEPLAPPERSLLAGATSKAQREYMVKVRDDVYKRLGVQSN